MNNSTNLTTANHLDLGYKAILEYLTVLSLNQSPQDYSLDNISLALFKLGNPQQDLKIIHVAGTSGKGSTTTLVSKILESQGFKVGTFVSPHIVDIRERIQINGEFISPQELEVIFNNIKYCLYEVKLSFFKTIVAVSLMHFKNEKVDYCVLEVGLGGQLDATNFPKDNKICVLNSIGLDHTNILGNTLELIAKQKAGIIQDNCQVVALSQSGEVNKVFETVASEFGTEINYVNSDQDFGKIELKIKNNKPCVAFGYVDLNQKIHQINLSLAGEYQASNCALALKSIEIISQKDSWTIDWSRVEIALNNVKLVGRFEVLEGFQTLESFENVEILESLEISNSTTKKANNQLTIIDGAHNPQKIQCFLDSLVQYYPNSRYNLLIAFKKGKDSQEMLLEILKHRAKINTIILTSFKTNQDSPIASQDPLELVNFLESQNFFDYIVETNCKAALDVLDNPNNFNSINIITGSLYLVSKIHELLN